MFAARLGGAVASCGGASTGRDIQDQNERRSNAGGGELGIMLSEIARDLHQQDDPQVALASVVAAAIAVVPGAQEASITVVLARRKVTSPVPSGELARAVDAIQDELGEGPCLDAVYEQRVVRVPDLSVEQRWPQFAPRAHDAGACSVLAFQLYAEGDNLGALNLYARRARAFDDESEHVGLLLATHAAIAYAGVRKQSQLIRAVASRGVIGQAQGILMERHKVTADEAFVLLVSASQHTNRKLQDIAEQLVHTGQLDVASRPPPPRRGGPARGD